MLTLLREDFTLRLPLTTVTHMTQLFTTASNHHHHYNHFTALFSGPPRWAPRWDGARRKLLLDFMVLGRITRGKHTNNPSGHHSIRTNQQPISINPPIFMPEALPATTLPIYPCLRQAQEYAGLHPMWLGLLHHCPNNQCWVWLLCKMFLFTYMLSLMWIWQWTASLSNNAVNQQLKRPGVLLTSWAGVDREASRDDGRQELVTSQAVNREWRQETGSEPDTAQLSHSYKQHGTVPCDNHTDSNNSTVPRQDHTRSSMAQCHVRTVQ